MTNINKTEADKMRNRAITRIYTPTTTNDTQTVRRLMEQDASTADADLRAISVPIQTISNSGRADESRVGGRSFSNACMFISIQDYLKYVKNIDISVTELRDQARFPGGSNEMWNANSRGHEESLRRLLAIYDLRVFLYNVPSYRVMNSNGTYSSRVLTGYSTRIAGMAYGNERSRNLLNVISYGAHFELITTSLSGIDYSRAVSAATRDNKNIGTYQPKYMALSGGEMKPTASKEKEEKKCATEAGQPTTQKEFESLQERRASLYAEQSREINQISSLLKAKELHNLEMVNLLSKLADLSMILSLSDLSGEQKMSAGSERDETNQTIANIKEEIQNIDSQVVNSRVQILSSGRTIIDMDAIIEIVLKDSQSPKQSTSTQSVRQIGGKRRDKQLARDAKMICSVFASFT